MAKYTMEQVPGTVGVFALFRVQRNGRPEGNTMTRAKAEAYIQQQQDDDADRMAADCGRDARGRYL